MTNGDRIRNMTDKEIAEGMSKSETMTFCGYCAYRKECYGNECKDGILKWLEQEASND